MDQVEQKKLMRELESLVPGLVKGQPISLALRMIILEIKRLRMLVEAKDE